MPQGLPSAKLQQQHHIKLQQVKALIICLHEMNKAAEVYKQCGGTCRCGSRQLLGWQQAAEPAGGHYLPAGKEGLTRCERQAPCLRGERQPSSACSNGWNVGVFNIQGEVGQVRGQR